MSRFLYDTTGVDEAAETAIARKAFQLANELGIDTIVFYVHTFDSVGWVERMFGRDAPMQLRNGYNNNGTVLELHSHRTFSEYGNECILVALGQNSTTLFELECIHRVRAIIALPWVQGECLDWASNLGAHDLNTDQLMDTYTLPCVVERALEELTRSINITSGITHPSDERRAKTIIRALNKYNYELNVPAIKAYLVENNWTKHGMNTMAELISTINHGGYFQGGDKTGLNHHKNRWEEECIE